MPNNNLSSVVKRYDHHEDIESFDIEFVRDVVEWAIAPFEDNEIEVD